MMRVAVVGAGFAGLAAADALASSGYEPVVFEGLKRVELGGERFAEQDAMTCLDRREVHGELAHQ